MAKKYTQAETYRIRYQLYRDLGYSAKDARRLRSHALDVSDIKLNKEGKPRKYSKNYLETKDTLSVDRYVIDMKDVKNDTVYTRWGMYINDKRYRDKTARTANTLRKRLKITNDQAYYFLYIMSRYDMTFEQTRIELMSNKEYEIYSDKKRTQHYRLKVKNRR